MKYEAHDVSSLRIVSGSEDCGRCFNSIIPRVNVMPRFGRGKQDISAHLGRYKLDHLLSQLKPEEHLAVDLKFTEPTRDLRLLLCNLLRTSLESVVSNINPHRDE
jgi:hypothetical protein